MLAWHIASVHPAELAVSPSAISPSLLMGIPLRCNYHLFFGHNFSLLVAKSQSHFDLTIGQFTISQFGKPLDINF
jgi:hypothetical protein